MEILIRSKHVEVSPQLKQLTEEKLAKVQRLTHDATRIEVEFSEERNPRISENEKCEVTLHLKHQVLKAHAYAADQTAALDLTVDKLEHQAAKLKDKRVTRRRRQPHGLPADIMANGAASVEEEEDDSGPKIVRTKRFSVKPMDVEEAALQMELLSHDFYLFTNSQNNRASVIYRRHDGHLGIIEASG